MDYTIESGQFYKVIENGEILTFGEMVEGIVLSTNSEVVFIDETEFKQLTLDAEESRDDI